MSQSTHQWCISPCISHRIKKSREWTYSTQQQYTYAGNEFLCFPPQCYLDVFAKSNNYPSTLCSNEPNTLKSNLKAIANIIEMKLTSVARCPCSQSVKCVGIHMNSDPVSRMLISLNSRDEVHAPLWRDVTRVHGSACLRMGRVVGRGGLHPIWIHLRYKMLLLYETYRSFWLAESDTYLYLLYMVGLLIFNAFFARWMENSAF